MTQDQIQTLIALREGWLTAWASDPLKAPSSLIVHSVLIELDWLRRRLGGAS